jgi:phosphatidylserine/phosphatidylglycerophosphate/cardiolipin synthase-like enzyme
MTRWSAAARIRPEERRTSVRLLADREHHENVVLGALSEARVSVWISTANLKEVMIEAPLGTTARARDRYLSITQRFLELVRRGVEVRILHASPPSRPLRKALARRPELEPPTFELRQCPRVHMKVIAVDGRYLYLGSANFTGAGLGAKGDGRRNFELGICTDDDWMLDAVQARYQAIWSGSECAACRLQAECGAPLSGE